MREINISKYSQVYYNEERKEYIKIFTPKFLKKIKYFFGITKYPGINFNYISKELNKIGVKTVEIVRYDKYEVVTKKLDGIILQDFLEKNYDTELIEQITKIIIDIIKAGFYYGDFAFDNFLVDKNKNIYAIDLEDYRKNIFSKRDKNYILGRMKGKLPQDMIDKIAKEL